MIDSSVFHLSAVSERPPPTKPEKEDRDATSSIYSMSEHEFRQYTKELCERRNLNLEGVKNVRDLVSTLRYCAFTSL